jgi:hypothetical protein
MGRTQFEDLVVYQLSETNNWPRTTVQLTVRRGSPDPADGPTEGLPEFACTVGVGDHRSTSVRGQETRAQRASSA